MVGGFAGIMFKELGWIVTIVICTSMLVAITLVPMLSSRLLKARDKDQEEKDSKKHRFTYKNTVMKWLAALDHFYANALRVCLKHKRITIIAAVLSLFVQ